MTSSSSDLFRSRGPTPPGGASKALPSRSEATLVDAVDHLLNRGAVLVGEATISLAGIDLIYVGLNLLVSSVETLEAASDSIPAASSPSPRRFSSGAGEKKDALTPALSQREISPPFPSQQEAGEGVRSPSSSPLCAGTGEGQGARPPGAEGGTASPLSSTGERPEQGLARLVLTLVELLRQTLERQAVRRMEGGALAEEEIERMGVALLELEQKMAELRDIFGLEEADLNLDLGPLGRLL